MEVEGVLTQACLAISVLAVKRKTDRVHNGNTRKLVTKGKIVFSLTSNILLLINNTTFYVFC